MKIHDTVRLVLTTQLSDREVADAVGLSKTIVGRYRRLATAKQFVWADLAHLTPAQLVRRFNRDPNGNKTRKVPDLAEIQQRLDEGHTLQVIWEDYRREDPHNTFSYSQLAARMRRYRRTLPTAMRMSHEPGFKVYVDFAGFKRVPLPTYLFHNVANRFHHGHDTVAGSPSFNGNGRLQGGQVGLSSFQAVTSGVVSLFNYGWTGSPE